MEKNLKKIGVVYILTNPSFPEYVKIGYTNDLDKRLNDFNSSPAVPFAFRTYAVYDVYHKLDDFKMHNIIDTINPELRSRDNINGKIREREFFMMSKEQAYSIFENMAKLTNTEDRLHLIKATEEEIEAAEEAETIRELAVNRHNFKDIEFHSSLTNKDYYTRTNELGRLSIFEKDKNIEISNYSNPSKKQIVRQALKDLGVEDIDDLTLYQLTHRLEKKVLNK